MRSTSNADSPALPAACAQNPRTALHPPPPLLVARQPMGGARFCRRAPFNTWDKISVWSLKRVENSGGIQASLAGRYATALFGLARDEQQIDAVGRSLDTLEAALAEFGRFPGAGDQPDGRPRRRRQGDRARWPRARPRPDHRPLPRRAGRQRPPRRAEVGHPHRPPAGRRPPRRDHRRSHLAPSRSTTTRSRRSRPSSRPASAATSRSTPRSTPPSSAESSSGSEAR